MSPRPQTYITTSTTTPANLPPTDTGVVFVTGITEKGPLAPTLVQSLDDHDRLFGGRVSYGVLRDALETFFREGGSKAYVSRVVGPAAVSADAVLFDASGSVDPGDVSLTVTAKAPGAWADELNVEVTAGDAAGEFKIVVSHDTDGVLETSPSLTDQAAAVVWSGSSEYVTLALGASAEDPRVQGPTSLAGGDDDRANITEDEWTDALDRFVKDLGPGQVAAPGRTTTAAHSALLQHASERRRWALLDLPDTGTAATLHALTTLQRNGLYARAGMAVGPWVEIPGLPATPSVSRIVPASTAVAGLMARSDGSGNSPAQPAAGANGILRFAVGLAQTFSDADLDTLHDKGVNVILEKYGQLRLYDYVTMVDPLGPDKGWLNAAIGREDMALRAELDVVAEEYQFSLIDGAEGAISGFHGAITGVCMEHHRDGALYGATPNEAFIVDTSDAVNTPESIAANNLKARVGVRYSEANFWTYIDLAKSPITSAL